MLQSGKRQAALSWNYKRLAGIELCNSYEFAKRLFDAGGECGIINKKTKD
jgi:hypothetical protein